MGSLEQATAKLESQTPQATTPKRMRSTISVPSSAAQTRLFASPLEFRGRAMGLGGSRHCERKFLDSAPFPERNAASERKNMIRASSFSAFLLFASLAAGCARSHAEAPPIHTEASLGRVVIYRNGVAYFERRATIQGNLLKLEVPGRRLDDFLKSLTITDVKTGKLVPISCPTRDDEADEVSIQLELPKQGVHELKITYVTESPSWKPSYRLELHGKKPARLEAWAVVHNVSGEDWKHVAVGVGSTSALSFKYDLKSVHFVDRETLSDEVRLGVAPPTGGSPYEVAKNEVQVLGAVRREGPAPKQPAPVSESRSGKALGYPAAPTVALDAAGSMAGGAGTGRGDGLAQVAQRARGTKQKIRVEGFAKPDD